MADDKRDPRLERIAGNLLKRTKEGKASWEVYEVDGNEVLSFSTAVSSVELWCKDGDGQHPFILRVLDESGIELDRRQSDRWEIGPFKEYVEQLYVIARRMALDVDKKIDLLLAELEEDEA